MNAREEIIIKHYLVHNTMCWIINNNFYRLLNISHWAGYHKYWSNSVKTKQYRLRIPTSRVRWVGAESARSLLVGGKCNEGERIESPKDHHHHHHRQRDRYILFTFSVYSTWSGTSSRNTTLSLIHLNSNVQSIIFSSKCVKALK